MTKFILIHSTFEVSQQTGFSAWVHMLNDEGGHEAYQAGYYPTIGAAALAAENAAKGMGKILEMQGTSFKIVDGGSQENGRAQVYADAKRELSSIE